MEQAAYYANFTSLIVIVLLWFAFAAAIFVRKRPKSAPDAKREDKSWLGLILQGAGFGIVWALQRRPLFSSVVPDRPAVGIILDAMAIIFALSGVWLATSAIKELGKQWSLAARLIEDHKLVTSGVYQIVRHPIYTAMFAMMLATGIVISHWLAIIIGSIVFYIGTKIRTRFEEKLLGNAFGPEFTQWKARVPGLIPFVGL